jgi:hypothetical protein
MKALTLTQPWASLVALKFKRYETRSWRTAYRGLLAIHAAKGFPEEAQIFAAHERAAGRLPVDVPRGAIVAVGRLVSCEKTEIVALAISDLERRLGDFQPGRWAWGLEGIVALDEPLPCRGALGLWDVPPSILSVLNLP